MNVASLYCYAVKICNCSASGTIYEYWYRRLGKRDMFKSLRLQNLSASNRFPLLFKFCSNTYLIAQKPCSAKLSISRSTSTLRSPAVIVVKAMPPCSGYCTIDPQCDRSTQDADALLCSASAHYKEKKPNRSLAQLHIGFVRFSVNNRKRHTEGRAGRNERKIIFMMEIFITI